MIKKHIREFTRLNTKLDSEFSYQVFLDYYTIHKNDSIIEKLGYLKEIYFHKKIADRQKKTYNRYRTDPEFLGDQILIDADYKEKIYYGKKSPRQQSNEWYTYGSCSLLGIGVYYVDSRFNSNTGLVEKFINCLTVDILSDESSQTAADFIEKFRFFRGLEQFKKIEKPRYIVFTDTAKSFRCDEVLYYFLIELENIGIKISYNFFCEYHGKVGHFCEIIKSLNINILKFK